MHLADAFIQSNLQCIQAIHLYCQYVCSLGLLISSQFSPPHTQDLQPTTSTDQTPIFSFCPLTEAEVSKLLLSSHPTTCPLDPIPSHLLQAISPALLPALTHIINTSLLTGIFPTAFKQALNIKHFSYRKLQTYLSPYIHSQNTRTSCLQSGLIVSFTEQQTEH